VEISSKGETPGPIITKDEKRGREMQQRERERNGMVTE